MNTEYTCCRTIKQVNNRAPVYWSSRLTEVLSTCATFSVQHRPPLYSIIYDRPIYTVRLFLSICLSLIRFVDNCVTTRICRSRVMTRCTTVKGKPNIKLWKYRWPSQLIILSPHGWVLHSITINCIRCLNVYGYGCAVNCCYTYQSDFIWL